MTCMSEISDECFGTLSRELLSAFERKDTNHHDAEDAVQDALVKLLQRSVSGMTDEVKNPLAWLRTVADRATWRSNQQRLPSNLDAAITYPAVFSDEVERRDEANIVQSALDMLPEQERNLVKFCDMEDGTLEEATEEFEISLHKVRTTLMKARARLRQQLLARGLGRDSN
jgi:RNA polymerase sigma factor (sigma-70 family)